MATRVTLAAPAGHPIREGANASTHADVLYALHRAARYLKAGGDRDRVEAFVDEWLDFQAELELREEIAAL